MPCRQLFLEVEAVAHTFAAHANIKVAKVDVLLYPAAFDRFSSHQTPLLVLSPFFSISFSFFLSCGCGAVSGGLRPLLPFTNLLLVLVLFLFSVSFLFLSSLLAASPCYWWNCLLVSGVFLLVCALPVSWCVRCLCCCLSVKHATH
jgi:hypothetical protein